ncbi:hypothetical protein Bcep1808_6732 (plasmid) [Burkholderia vietnamiensis G4]|uniref:Uncharacterized protein n=1 Tax=Burkholderia vietnamiensis (strain G4 / LMG 22486) TaxID=269482 RepID=A4JTL7_BURVG|nr:hypothetical protein Bcep1808_6732 [Burkholderia vietnamiensis G4]
MMAADNPFDYPSDGPAVHIAADGALIRPAPVKDMVRELASSLSDRRLNIFAPPDLNYWHAFTWDGQRYAANLYICDSTAETFLDLFPLVADAADMGMPLAIGQRVADCIFLLPAGNA